MRRPRARAVDWKEERVGDQRSWRERKGPTGTPRIEEEGEREEGGQEVGREGGEGGGHMEGEMVHLEGLSSPPKLEVKEAETEEKDSRKRGEEERMDRSST